MFLKDFADWLADLGLSEIELAIMGLCSVVNGPTGLEYRATRQA